ncbi:MAG TPA: hypothetical protein VGN86_16485 [Pyrinomonadaceae bacterium]|nr:hypothetical protein [Pyrinomonadaceae bacterium]
MDGDDNLKAELAKAVSECEHLREENARLKLLICETPDRRPRPAQPTLLVKEKPQSSPTVTVDSRPEVKVSLFMDLFRGRDDVYAVRWEGKDGKTAIRLRVTASGSDSLSLVEGRRNHFASPSCTR